MKTTKYVCGGCSYEFEGSVTVTTDEGVYQGCPHCGCWDFAPKRIGVTKSELKQYVFLCRESEKMRDKLSAKNIDSGELYEMYENNRLRCMALMMRIESFIFNIDDSLLRQVFEARYIKRQSWNRVSISLGGYYSADYLRIMHDRFLKKLEK